MAQFDVSDGSGTTSDSTSGTDQERREPEDSIAETDSTSESDPMTDLGDVTTPDSGYVDAPDTGSTTDPSSSSGSNGGASSGMSGGSGVVDAPSVDDSETDSGGGESSTPAPEDIGGQPVDAPTTGDTDENGEATSGGGGTSTGGDESTSTRGSGGGPVQAPEDSADSSMGDGSADTGGDSSPPVDIGGQPVDAPDVDEAETTEPPSDDTDGQDTGASGMPEAGSPLDAPEDTSGSTATETDSGSDDSGTSPGTPGEGGTVDAPAGSGGDSNGSSQPVTPDTGGTADAPGTGSETVDRQGDDRTGAPVRDDFDSTAAYVEASTASAFESVDEGGIFTVQEGRNVEARFTESGAERAAAELLGEGVTASDIEFDREPAFGYTIDDIQRVAQREQADLAGELQRYEGERRNLQTDIVSEAQYEAGQSVQRREEEMQSDLSRGSLGDPREIRREQAASALSERYGFTVEEGDVDVVREEGDLRVLVDRRVAEAGRLSQEAQQNASGSVNIQRTQDGGFNVDIEDGFASSGETAREVEADLAEAGGRDTVDVEPVGQSSATPGVDYLSQQDSRSGVESAVSLSTDLTRSITQNVVQPAAAATGDALDVGLARERGEYDQVATGDADETVAGGVAEQVAVGAGEAGTALTVGLPSLAEQGASLAAGSARYTASEVREGDIVDPVVAGGEFAAGVAAEEARFAASQPARYTGQLAAGALIGGAAGRAAASAAPAGLTGGRLGAATRTVVDPVRTSARAGRRGIARLRDADTPNIPFPRDERGMAQIPQGRRSGGDSASGDSGGLSSQIGESLRRFERATRMREARRRAEERVRERIQESTPDLDDPFVADDGPGSRSPGTDESIGNPNPGTPGPATYRSGPTETQVRTWQSGRVATRRGGTQQRASTETGGPMSSAGLVGASRASGAAAGAAVEPIGILDAAQTPQVPVDDAVTGVAEPSQRLGTGVDVAGVALVQQAQEPSELTAQGVVEDSIAATGTGSTADVSFGVDSDASTGVDTGVGTGVEPGIDVGVGSDTDAGVDSGVDSDVTTQPEASPVVTPDTGVQAPVAPGFGEAVGPGVIPAVDEGLTQRPSPAFQPDPAVTPDLTPRPDGDDDEEDFGLLGTSGFEGAGRQYVQELANPLAGPDTDSESDSQRDDSEPLLGGFL